MGEDKMIQHPEDSKVLENNRRKKRKGRGWGTEDDPD